MTYVTKYQFSRKRHYKTDLPVQILFLCRSVLVVYLGERVARQRAQVKVDIGFGKRHRSEEDLEPGRWILYEAGNRWSV